MHPLICGRPSQARPGHGILAPPIQQSRRICLSSLFTPFFLHLQHQQHQQPWPWQVASRNTSRDTQCCARAVPTCCLVVCSCLRFRPNFGRHHPPPSPDVFSFLLLVYSSAERVIGVASAVVVVVSCCLAISAPIALSKVFL